VTGAGVTAISGGAIATPGAATVTLTGVGVAATAAGVVTAAAGAGSVAVAGVGVSAAAAGAVTVAPGAAAVAVTGVGPAALATGVAFVVPGVGVVAVTGADAAGVLVPLVAFRVSRYLWRYDALAALAWQYGGSAAYAWRAGVPSGSPPARAWRHDATAAYAWRYDGVENCPGEWGEDMASVNHWSQHLGETKSFLLTPKTLLSGANPYTGWTVRLTVVDEKGDWQAAEPPAVLLRKSASIDAATGVITCTVTKADTDTIRAAAGGLGGFYHFVERVDASDPLVLDEGAYNLEPSALEAPP
jgi:hypothetical protein